MLGVDCGPVHGGAGLVWQETGSGLKRESWAWNTPDQAAEMQHRVLGAARRHAAAGRRVVWVAEEPIYDKRRPSACLFQWRSLLAWANTAGRAGAQLRVVAVADWRARLGVPNDDARHAAQVSVGWVRFLFPVQLGPGGPGRAPEEHECDGLLLGIVELPGAANLALEQLRIGARRGVRPAVELMRAMAAPPPPRQVRATATAPASLPARWRDCTPEELARLAGRGGRP